MTIPSPDLPGEDFRRLGHELVDWIADFLARSDEIPVFPHTRPGEIRRQLPSLAPETGESLDNFLADVERMFFELGR